MNVVDVMSSTISTTILNLDLNKIFYIVLLAFNLMQAILCIFSAHNSFLFNIFKWLDLGLILEGNFLIYLLFAPCLLSTISIVLQFYWSITSKSNRNKTLIYYTIKISSIISFFLCHTQCISQIRCAVRMIISAQLSFQILGVIYSVFFIGIIYPYSLFLVTDLGPMNRRIYSSTCFPNCITFINIYRLIASLMISTNNSSYLIVISSLLFISLVAGLVRNPIITWSSNLLSQIYVICLIWTLLYQFISMACKIEDDVVYYVIGLVIFIVSFLWVLQKRVLAILENPTNTVLKLKILYYLMLNREQFQRQLNVFLLTHYRQCSSVACTCSKVINELSKQKQFKQNIVLKIQDSNTMKNDSNNKHNFQLLMKLKSKKQKKIEQFKSIIRQQIKQDAQRQQNISNQQKCWFELLLYLQNDSFNIQRIKNMPESERHVQMKKSYYIIFDQIQILRHQLNQQYQSLKFIWLAEEIKKISCSIFLKVRLNLEIFKQEQTIRKKSVEDGSNLYALNYYEIQTKIIRFKQQILKVLQKIQIFWRGLISSNNDKKTIQKGLSHVLGNLKQLKGQRKEFQKQFEAKSKQNLNQYQRGWNQKMKKYLQGQYKIFDNVIHGNYAISESMKEELENNQNQNILQKNLKFYNHKALTGMSVVNIQDGQDFGLITTTNAYFWQLINYKKFQKARINDFLVKQMHEYHTQTMINFLNQNKHFLNFHHGLIIDSSNLIVQIQFSVQLLPLLADGLFAAVFIQKIQNPISILLLNSGSNILCYNEMFKDKFLNEEVVQTYDQYITKEVLQKLLQNKEHEMYINNQNVTLQLFYIINASQEQKKLYYCQITKEQQKNDKLNQISANIPILIRQNSKMGTNSIRKSLSCEKKCDKSQTKQRISQAQQNKFSYLIKNLLTQKQSFGRKKWKIFVIISLLIIIILSSTCSGLSNLRKSAFTSAFVNYHNLTNIVQQISNGAFLARKGNILSYTNQTDQINKIKQKIYKINQKLGQHSNFLATGVANMLMPFYEIYQDGKIMKKETTISMILSDVLSSYTTYLSDSSKWSFNYIHKQNSKPFSPTYTNFLNLIENSYYILIPNLVESCRKFVKNSWKDKITISVPIVPICMAIILVGCIMLAVTFVFRLKIRSAVIKSFKLFKYVCVDQIINRLKLISNYSETHLKEVHSATKRSSSQHKYNISNLAKASETKRQKEIYTCELTEANLQLTGRNSAVKCPPYLLQFKQDQPPNSQQQNQIIENQMQIKIVNSNNRKLDISIKNDEKLIMIFKCSLAIVPILLLVFAIVYYQLRQNFNVWDLLNLKDLYGRKLQNINLLNSYSSQMGLQIQYFRGKDISLMTQMQKILQDIYQINRNVQQAQSEVDQNFIQYANRIKSMPFCQILNSISTASQDRCSQDQKSKLGTKTHEQVFVQYIETARSLYNEYKKIRFTKQDQQKFVFDSRHNILEKINHYLWVIYKQINLKFDEIYRNYNNRYQTIIITLSLSAVAFTLIVLKIWVTIQLKEIDYENDQIKSIFWLIFSSQIENNKQLRQNILDNLESFEIVY